MSRGRRESRQDVYETGQKFHTASKVTYREIINAEEEEKTGQTPIFGFQSCKQECRGKKINTTCHTNC